MPALADISARVMPTTTRASVSGALALPLNVAFPIVKACKHQPFGCTSVKINMPLETQVLKQSAAEETVDTFLQKYSKLYSFCFNPFVYKILIIVSLILTSLII